MNLPIDFKTERLVLRNPALSDANAIFTEYASDQEAVRYMTWEVCTNVSQVEEFLKFLANDIESKTDQYWVIGLSKTNQLIGMLSAYSQGHKMSFGYILGRNYWNKGYMIEALKALIEIALSDSKLFRIWATCDIENKRSLRVMEKCGLKSEGVLQRWIIHPNRSAEPRDSFILALTL